jgi:hypothetical protein
VTFTFTDKVMRDVIDDGLYDDRVLDLIRSEHRHKTLSLGRQVLLRPLSRHFIPPGSVLAGLKEQEMKLSSSLATTLHGVPFS